MSHGRHFNRSVRLFYDKLTPHIYVWSTTKAHKSLVTLCVWPICSSLYNHHIIRFVHEPCPKRCVYESLLQSLIILKPCTKP